MTLDLVMGLVSCTGAVRRPGADVGVVCRSSLLVKHTALLLATSASRPPSGNVLLCVDTAETT